MCHSLGEIVTYAHQTPKPPAATVCAARGTKRSHHRNGDIASLAAKERAGPTSPAASHTDRSYTLLPSPTSLGKKAACLYLVTQTTGKTESGEGSRTQNYGEASPALNAGETAAGTDCAGLSGVTPGGPSVHFCCDGGRRSPQMSQSFLFKSNFFSRISSHSPFRTQEKPREHFPVLSSSPIHIWATLPSQTQEASSRSNPVHGGTPETVDVK